MSPKPLAEKYLHGSPRRPRRAEVQPHGGGGVGRVPGQAVRLGGGVLLR